MSQETVFMLHSLVLGAFFSFLYDCIRIFRRLFPQGWFGIAFGNLLYWIVCGIWVFLFLHEEGNGTIRWFAVLGASLGIWTYLKWISPHFLKISLWALRPIVNFFRKIFVFCGIKMSQSLKMLLTAIRKMLTMVSKEVMKHGSTLRRR